MLNFNINTLTNGQPTKMLRLWKSKKWSRSRTRYWGCRMWSPAIPRITSLLLHASFSTMVKPMVMIPFWISTSLATPISIILRVKTISTLICSTISVPQRVPLWLLVLIASMVF